MFFRILLLSWLFISLTSCSLPLNELPTTIPQQDSGKLGEETRCLSDVLPTMEAFMNGTATAQKISDTWICFKDGLSLFQKRVRGEKYPDKFTSREIAKFFEDLFLDENIKINDVLLREIFKLKKIFVGGDVNLITRGEIEKLKTFAEAIRVLSLKILPYMKIYSFNWNPNSKSLDESEMSFFEDANLAIQDAAKMISSVIASNRQDYRISDFAVLLRELAGLYQEHWQIADDIEKAMPLIQKLKLTLAGGREETIEAHEWRRFSLIGARGFVQYMRYHYFLKDSDAFGSAPEIHFLFRSVDDLFSYFGDMVREKPGGRFTKDELLQIIKALTSFFPDILITEELVNQAMKIKILIFGGSEDQFVPEEFEYARTKVDSFRSITTRVVQYADVYGLSWHPEKLPEAEGKEYFVQAKQSLKQIGSDLANQFDTSYDLNNLIKLAEEIDKLSLERNRKPKEWGKLAQQYIPLAVSFKNMIASDQSSVVGRSQWPRILDWVAQIYTQYAYFHYFAKDKTWFGGKGLAEFEIITQDLVKLFKGLLQTKPNFQIPLSEIYRMTNALVRAEVLDKRVQETSINILVDAIVKKWLTNPLDRLAGKTPTGITEQTLVVLQSELEHWIQGERHIDGLISQTGGIIGVSHKQFKDFWMDAESSNVVNEFVLVFDSMIPMTFNNQIMGRPDDRVPQDNDRLFLSYQEGRYNLRNAGFINIFRAIYRIILRSYSKDLNRINFYSGTNREEMRELFRDVKPFFSDMEMLDPRKDDFIDKRYRDGSLFTSAADGDDSYLNFKEGFDLALMIFSGVSVDEELSTAIKDNCPITPAAFKPDRTVEIECLMDTYVMKYDTAFKQLPDLVKHFRGLSKAEFSELAINLLKAAGYTPDGTTQIKLGDAALFPFVVQYLETAFQRFDRGPDGGDNFINTQEAIAAFPVFQKMLGRVANVSDELLLAAFTFILDRTRIPNAVELIIWNKNKAKWKLAVDRRKLGKVFGILADELAKKP